MQRKPNRRDLHLPRRLFHLLNGVLLVGTFYLIKTKKEAVYTLASLTLFAWSADWLRIHWKAFGDLVAKTFQSVMRQGEDQNISGIPYYLLGCTISVIVFPKPIALLAILYLAVGDPIASLAGNLHGKRQLPQRMDLETKSWEGSIACFVVCSTMTFFVVPFIFGDLPLLLGQKIALSLIGGFGAAFAEILPLRTDDNLTLPVVSGAFLWIAASLSELIPGLYF